MIKFNVNVHINAFIKTIICSSKDVSTIINNFSITVEDVYGNLPDDVDFFVDTYVKDCVSSLSYQSFLNCVLTLDHESMHISNDLENIDVLLRAAMLSFCFTMNRVLT